MKLTRHKLEDLLTVTRGASLPGTGYADEGRYLRLTLANFKEEGGFKEFKSTEGKFFTGDFKEKFLMKRGDLITPLTEQSPGLLGSVALIPCDDLYIQSQDVGLIECDETKIDKRFAYYLFLTKSVREQIAAKSQQTKIRHTSPEKIEDVTVDIPDKSDQLRIAGLHGTNLSFASCAAISASRAAPRALRSARFFCASARRAWNSSSVMSMCSILISKYCPAERE